VAVGERRRFKPGELLKHKLDGEIVTYVGPPNGPWANHEGWAIVRFARALAILPNNHEFNVDLQYYVKVDFIDAIAGLDR
jgi:hypothetical protein